MNNGYIESPNAQYGQSGFNHNVQPKKNGTKILIAIIVIVLLLCCGGIGVIVAIVINATKPKEPIDSDKIEQVARELDYSIYDYSSDGYLSFYKDDNNAEISYEEWYQEDLAASQVNTYLDIYDFDDAQTTSKVNGVNYEKYSWKVDGYYYFLYRVDTAVVWVESSSKDDITNFKDKMNY